MLIRMGEGFESSEWLEFGLEFRTHEFPWESISLFGRPAYLFVRAFSSKGYLNLTGTVNPLYLLCYLYSQAPPSSAAPAILM